tara:strand:- start:2955 stop:3851 length:897 start_codon:yes stop_codon:yes gene_type:complete
MTVTGMGRGAGNLKTELLLSVLNNKKSIYFNIKYLTNCVSKFENLKNKHKWGTNLPYMISGVNSLPQKDVMQWIGMNRYNLQTIVKTLTKDKIHKENMNDLKIFKNNAKTERVLVVGGGNSVSNSLKAIKYFLNLNSDIVIIHTGIKYIHEFLSLKNKSYYCLSGNEPDELEKILLNYKKIEDLCFIYPPSPTKMELSIPQKVLKNSFQIDKINFINSYFDSPLAISIQVAINLSANTFYFVGFDGYNTIKNQSQTKLSKENQDIFNVFVNNFNYDLFSLTPTYYKAIKSKSIYSMII